MTEFTFKDFPPELTETRDVEDIIPMLGFVGENDVHERTFNGVYFSIGTWLGCHMLFRDGRVGKNVITTPHEIRVFSPVAPIELMATIYRLWAEIFENQVPQDDILCMGKRWIDYRNELKRLIPPPPTLWVEREFLRHSLNYIDRQRDWVEKDYLVTFSSLPGQLRIFAEGIELFCPARGDWIGEVSVSAKELFRHLPKRFNGPVVVLQIDADQLRIDNRLIQATWSESHNGGADIKHRH